MVSKIGELGSFNQAYNTFINNIHVLCNISSQFTGLHNMAAVTPASAATAIIEAYYVPSMYMEFMVSAPKAAKVEWHECDGASVLGHVKSHRKHLPCEKGMRVAPSGHFLSPLRRWKKLDWNIQAAERPCNDVVRHAVMSVTASATAQDNP